MSDIITFIADTDCIENWQDVLSLAPEFSVDIRTTGNETLPDDGSNCMYIVRWPNTGIVGDLLCASVSERRANSQNVICVTRDLPLSSPLESFRPSIVRPDIPARDLLVVARLMTAGYSVSPSGPPTDEKTPLSPREFIVLEHIAAGQSNKTIASQLRLSQHTIRVHVQNILRKLGVSNRTEAALCFMKKERFFRAGDEITSCINCR